MNPIQRYADSSSYVPGNRCPECGSDQFTLKDVVGHGYRVCIECNQEWSTDIDYSPKPLSAPTHSTESRPERNHPVR